MMNPTIPSYVKGIVMYSFLRNGFYISQLPEKDRYNKEPILIVDKVLMYPIANLYTCFLFPCKIYNDLRRLEYSIRNIPLPNTLKMDSLGDFIFG